jgi:ubiquinone/menaquinone biosynthesis C-methylase UbiE
MQTDAAGGLPETEFRNWAVTVRKHQPPASMEDYLQGWRDFFDHFAPVVDEWHSRNAGYHENIKKLVKFYVPPGVKVLEVGCATGDLLAATNPSVGVGIDISNEMTKLAKQKYPHLTFQQMAAEELDLGDQKFDYIILSDMVGFFYDIKLVFERLRTVCNPDTRIVIHWYSRLWQPVLTLAEKMGLKFPQPLLNWTTAADIANLLSLAEFEPVYRRQYILVPKRIPFSRFLNRYLSQLPILRHLCLTNWIVARPLHLPARISKPTVSVICACRNEAGNIEQIVRRLPEMGAHTELIFVEGHSKDETLAECRRMNEVFPERDIKVYVQEGKGKCDAVRLGFAKATGDIVMILDADVSVVPEDLTQFYEALVTGKGDFINGSRLVYLMDPEAMRFLNVLGNKFFAAALSLLLGQPVKDTLCGTKVMWRDKYEELARGRTYFGDFDPFGDYDLLFGAAKLNLKIVEVPVRYRQRVYGSTNISRFSDGFLLLRMCRVAAAKLYFVG